MTARVSSSVKSPSRRLAVAIATVLLASVALTGCGRSTRRPAIIEGRSGGLDVLYTFTYEGSNLVEVEYEVEGDRAETWELTWEAGQLAELVIEPRNGDDTVHTFTWEGGRLAEKVVERGNSETTIVYAYEGADLKEITVESRVGGDRVSDDETAITYDNGRLSRVVTDSSYSIGPLNFDTTAETEYSYDDQGRLEDTRTDYSGDASGRVRVDFEYSDTGKLALVEREGRDYELSYDDQGRLEEIDDEDGYRYDIDYDDGAVSGLVFDVTFVPYGALFDLEGRGFTSYDTTSLSFLLSSGSL